MRFARYKSEICLMAVFSLLMCSGACGFASRTWSSTRALVKGDLKVSVSIAEEANQDNRISVDVVLFFDEGLLKKLAGYSAKIWFKKRGQIQLDVPDFSRIELLLIVLIILFLQLIIQLYCLQKQIQKL